MTLLNLSPDAKPLGGTILTEFSPAEKTQLENLWQSRNESIIGKLSTSSGIFILVDMLRNAQRNLMAPSISVYCNIANEVSSRQNEASSTLLIRKIFVSNPNITVAEFRLPEFRLHSDRRAINTDKDSPDVAQSDIDRFYMLKGETLLTLDFSNKNIPPASIENGINREIHIEWVLDDLEAFVSVWPECKTATFVGKNYISGENEVEKFELEEELGFSPIKNKIVNFFESI